MTAISLTDTLFNIKSEIRILDEEQKPNKETLLKCFRKMCNIFTECQYMKRFNALVKKYQKEKYSKVARLKITKKWLYKLMLHNQVENFFLNIFVLLFW